MGGPVRRVHDELPCADAAQQGEQHPGRDRRAFGGATVGSESIGKGMWRAGVDVSTGHRVVACAGGLGLAKKGTRFAQSRSACQWMRAITPSVNRG